MAVRYRVYLHLHLEVQVVLGQELLYVQQQGLKGVEECLEVQHHLLSRGPQRLKECFSRGHKLHAHVDVNLLHNIRHERPFPIEIGIVRRQWSLPGIYTNACVYTWQDSVRSYKLRGVHTP